MRGGRYNWPSFTLDEERALAEKARRMNGKNENGSTEDGFENCAVPIINSDIRKTGLNPSEI